jgi:hypothetical protein
MEIDTLKNIFILTAKRSALRQYKYHVLDRFRLSEPEIRDVMSKILIEYKVHYGIEYPTLVKHKISGETRSRSALVDLVIYEKDNLRHAKTWIEFKRGQVDIQNIKKDFIKMLKEPSIELVSFFHILPKIGSKSEKSKQTSQRSILKKYLEAYNSTPKEGCHPKIFILFIMDVESRQYYFCKKDNICAIERFDDGDWSRI